MSLAQTNLTYTITPAFYDPGSILHAELILDSEEGVLGRRIDFECYNGTALGPEGGQWSQYVEGSFRDLSENPNLSVQTANNERGYFDIQVAPRQGDTFSLPLHFAFDIRISAADRVPDQLTMACTGYLNLVTAGQLVPRLVFAYQLIYRIVPPAVQVIKQSRPSRVAPGDTLWYHLSLQNASPIPVRHIRLQDHLDASLRVEEVRVQAPGQPERQMEFLFDRATGTLYVPGLTSSEQLVVETGGQATSVYIKTTVIGPPAAPAPDKT